MHFGYKRIIFEPISRSRFLFFFLVRHETRVMTLEITRSFPAPHQFMVNNEHSEKGIVCQEA